METRSGRVRGERLPDGTCAFRGVPYAAPPVGARRWRAPERAEPWAGVRDASRPGPAAPQGAGMVARLLGSHEERWDEDCLTLSVWTPGCDGARRPVLVWIHGGGFTVGASSWSVYDAAELARRGDVVVVGINYRLGALGWLALPDAGEGPAANFGMLDQIAALAWVREHAERFGGDPGAVTAFGSSAGAMSLAALLAAPAARGLFARAILQSGAARNAHRPEAAERVAETFARELGARPGDLATLRRFAAKDVLAAQMRTSQALRVAMDALPFQPCADGAVLPELPREAIRAGRAAPVPLVVGTNLEEWKFYGLADPAAHELDLAGLRARCARALSSTRALPGDPPEGGALAEHAIEVYTAARRERGESTDPPELWFAIETDRWFGAPAAELAATHRGPVWSYVFTWRTPALGGRAGACHSLEVPFLFSLESELGRVVAGEDPGARTLSRRMQGAWLAFAREGDPHTEALPDWRCRRPATRETQLLGVECPVVEGFREPEWRFWERIG